VKLSEFEELRANQSTADLVRALAERYLRHVNEMSGLGDDRWLLYGLAAMSDHLDDYGLLAALWNVPDTDIPEHLRDLAQRHDFVLSRRTGTPSAVMHRLIRETLRRRLLEDDQRVSLKAAVACHEDGTRVLPRPRDHLGCVVRMAAGAGGVNRAVGRARCEPGWGWVWCRPGFRGDRESRVGFVLRMRLRCVTSGSLALSVGLAFDDEFVGGGGESVHCGLC